MKLVVGLGNIGQNYTDTRHNAGFMSVDTFAEKFSIKLDMQNKFKGFVGRGMILGEDVFLLKPSTFMNLSGEAIIALVNFYKISIDDILVVYDDISLELGVLRFRASGSAGGHNGIKSIIKNLGQEKFARLKIGIGPQPDFMPSERFVLQKFTNEELLLLKNINNKTTEAIEFWVKNGVEKTIPKFNGKVI